MDEFFDYEYDYRRNFGNWRVNLQAGREANGGWLHIAFKAGTFKHGYRVTGVHLHAQLGPWGMWLGVNR